MKPKHPEPIVHQGFYRTMTSVVFCLGEPIDKNNPDNRQYTMCYHIKDSRIHHVPQRAVDMSMVHNQNEVLELCDVFLKLLQSLKDHASDSEKTWLRIFNAITDYKNALLMPVYIDSENRYVEVANNGLEYTGQHYKIVMPAVNGDDPEVIELSFQAGSIAEAGVNGLTNECLLAVLIHRMKILNRTLPCEENNRAIGHLEDALANLEVRTQRRRLRRVEGKPVT